MPPEPDLRPFEAREGSAAVLLPKKPAHRPREGEELRFNNSITMKQEAWAQLLIWGKYPGRVIEALITFAQKPQGSRFEPHKFNLTPPYVPPVKVKK